MKIIKGEIIKGDTTLNIKGRVPFRVSPAGLSDGTFTLSTSGPSAVRFFDDQGQELTSLSVNLADPSGYLAGVMTGGVDVWMEGLHKDSDLIINTGYTDPAGNEIARDTVHMLLADWNLIGKDGNAITSVASIGSSLLDGMSRGNPFYSLPDKGVSFKNRIDGLSTNLITQLKVSSLAPGGDSFFDTLGTSDSSAQSSDYTILYSSIGTPQFIDSAERDQLKEASQLNAVHNDGFLEEMTLQLDKQMRQAKAATVGIQVDANHDRAISFSDTDSMKKDQTTPDHPFRFWRNDDTDVKDTSSGTEVYSEGEGGATDYSTGKINNERDLEDFARLSTDMASLPPGYSVKLKLVSDDAAMRLRLFRDTTDSIGANYLTDQNYARSLTSRAIAIGELTPGQEISLQSHSEDYVFEAGGAGTGRLDLEMYDNHGALGGVKSVYVQFQRAQDMYETYQVANGATTGEWPDPKVKAIPRNASHFGSFRYTTNSPESD